MYYARITATIDHFRNVEGRKICDKIAGQFYLKREEYSAQHPTWCKQDCWEVLAAEWSSAEFRQRSEKNRAIAIIRQKLSKKLGREVSDIEAWVHTHRGSNPEDITSLNTEEATSCLEEYKAKAIELNGPDSDWLHSPVDARALYQCSCGRPHGKWATFNGIVNDSEALADLKRSQALVDLKRSRTSAMAARHRRQEEEERMRKEAHDSRLAKEYAQNMLEWGRMVHAHNENIQRFMEHVVAHTGMPTTLVPSLLPPPPLPPTYDVSPSPNLSPENAGTYGSFVRAETPEETLSRIANGVFRGHVNATTSGGGTYYPQEDEIQFF